MGLGFTVALTLIGACRELLGAGQLFGYQILGADNVFYQAGSLRPLAMFLGEYTNISIFIMAPGAFFVLAFIIAAMNRIRRSAAKKGKRIAPASDCTGCMGKNCAECAGGLKDDTSIQKQDETPVQRNVNTSSQEQNGASVQDGAAQDTENGEGESAT